MEAGPEKLKLIHILAFVAVVIGLIWVYRDAENPDSKPGSEVVEGFDWDGIAEARAAAVAYAGAVKLAESGQNMQGLELLSADTEDGDSYRVRYQQGNQTITLFAERQCDRLDMELLQRPGCWIWR